MPDYLVTDPATGQRIKMTGPAPPSEALIRLALAKVTPLPSHEPAVKQTQDPLQAMQKAQTIGPARVGERYMEPLNPSAVDVVRSLAGGAARPTSVAATDPYGIEAWQKGAGPMPMPMMGETEGLYSRLDQAIAKLPDTKLPPMKILSTAKNATSGEEIAHRGLADFLQAAGGKPVARSEVQAHLAANPIQLDVKELGVKNKVERLGTDRWLVNGEPATLSQATDASIPEPTKYSQYQVPGGTAYKETLITLPFEKKGLGEVKEGESLMEALDRAQASHPVFKSSHFEQPNILVHVRSNERTLPTGEPGLFLEEVQSDWHQQGKQRGYNTPAPEMTVRPRRDGDIGTAPFLAEANGVIVGGGPTEQAARLAGERFMPQFTDARLQGGVPDAPFKEQWPDLALKHQLLDAAKRPDLQWLGFTSGETQAARYDLSKQIDRVIWRPRLSDPEIGELIAYDKNNYQVMNKPTVRSEIADHIGKEVASKLLEQTPSAGGPGIYGLRGDHILKNADLQVGGEGMKYFYDQLLPKRLEKIVKPFGGTVERAPIQGGRDVSVIAREMDALAEQQPLTPAQWQRHGELYQELKAAGKTTNVHGWIVRLSPEMKQRILKEGLPLMTGVAAVAASQQEQK